MKWVKTALLGAVFVSTAAALTSAAEAQTTSAYGYGYGYPPQVAANPYSYNRLPGPKVSGDNWIPSPYTASPVATPAPYYNTTNGGAYYTGRSFGPKTN